MTASPGRRVHAGAAVPHRQMGALVVTGHVRHGADEPWGNRCGAVSERGRGLAGSLRAGAVIGRGGACSGRGGCFVL
ncbi:hypothetical protein ACWV95_34370 [Streptomyces albus]